MVKCVVAAMAALLALAAGAAAAESKMAKKFDAGPAIQGNSDPATPMHKAKHRAHRKAM